MDAALQTLYNEDSGFAQFVERHGTVSSTPDVRKQYRRWEYELALENLHNERVAERQEEEKKAKFDEGIAIGEAKGIAIGEAKGIAIGEAKSEIKFTEGKAEGKAESAIKMLAKGFSLDDIQDITGLTLAEIKALQPK